jgi:hypothetical protein
VDDVHAYSHELIREVSKCDACRMLAILEIKGRGRRKWQGGGSVDCVGKVCVGIVEYRVSHV